MPLPGDCLFLEFEMSYSERNKTQKQNGDEIVDDEV